MKYGTIAADDLKLFQYADTPEAALALLQDMLTAHHLQPEDVRRETEGAPDIATSNV